MNFAVVSSLLVTVCTLFAFLKVNITNLDHVITANRTFYDKDYYYVELPFSFDENLYDWLFRLIKEEHQAKS